MTDADVTLLLEGIRRGDTDAYDRLVPVIERRLHQMARASLRRERAGHTLRPTELVNEAYIRLAGGEQAWEGRRHFYGAAAEAMRRVLIDHARRRSAQKRGGGVEQVTFHDIQFASDEPDVDVLALDEALTALQEVDGRLAQVVRLRYFAGFSIDEVAEILGVSSPTVKRDWRYARAWLLERMTDE